jgi:hypothetical protein
LNADVLVSLTIFRFIATLFLNVSILLIFFLTFLKKEEPFD